MKTEDAKALADSAVTKLIEALESGHSEALTAYLATAAKFHRYSFGNIMLISMQRPDATRVAGFHAWRKLGRFVRKGEKGIVILAPMVARCRDSRDTASPVEELETRTVLGFKAAHVFDVAQTDGEALPDFAEVTGDPGIYAERLQSFVRSLGIALDFSNAELGSALGASTKGRIILRENLSPAATFSVLAHELAHELLHDSERRQETTATVRETEAEAVAFIVCHAVGLDTNSAASDYIQLYRGTKETLLESLEHIQRTAAAILAAVEPGE